MSHYKRGESSDARRVYVIEESIVPEATVATTDEPTIIVRTLPPVTPLARIAEMPMIALPTAPPHYESVPTTQVVTTRYTLRSGPISRYRRQLRVRCDRRQCARRGSRRPVNRSFRENVNGELQSPSIQRLRIPNSHSM